MAEIFYRAQYTAPVPGTITDGFTITLSSGYTAAPDDTRGYFVIIDDSTPTMFANVIGTITGGNNLKVNRVEYDSTRSDGVPPLTNALPAFSSTVKIMSSLPLVKYGDEMGPGLDGILILGDYNAFGHNGAPHNGITYDTEGWHPVLDTMDSNVLMFRYNVSQIINEDHTGIESVGDSLLNNSVTPATDPLPVLSGNTNGLWSPINGAGFGVTFGKEYYHRLPGTRRCCLVNYPADSSKRLAAGYTSDAHRGIGVSNSFEGLDIGNNKTKVIIICLGMGDAIAGTTGVSFQASFDAIINDHRVQISPSIPIIVCSLPAASITAIGGTEAVDINNVILDTPNRIAGVSVAIPGAYTLDATGLYIDAPGQREFGKVIFNALEAAMDNQTL